MNDFSSIWLAACGLGVVCCGSLLLLVFFFLRVASLESLFAIVPAFAGLFSGLGDLLGMGGNDNDDDDSSSGSRRSRGGTQQPSTLNIQSRIDAAKNSGFAAPPSDDPHAGSSNMPPSVRKRPFPTTNTPSDAGRSLRDRRRFRDNDTGEQVFGGAFDSDFDDIPDFFDNDNDDRR